MFQYNKIYKYSLFILFTILILSQIQCSDNYYFFIKNILYFSIVYLFLDIYFPTVNLDALNSYKN